jgi:putative acetyltransferase
LNTAAFGSPAEAVLVDVLRSSVATLVSLVAAEDGEIQGHIMFSPVRIDGAADVRAMGLAPMAVTPERQRRGIGTSLIAAGLEQCRQAGVEAVFVVGHPTYYPRYGFVPARGLGFTCEFNVRDDAFMVIELVRGRLERRAGTVHFHEAFKDV